MRIEVIEVRPSSAKRDAENVWLRVGVNGAVDAKVSERDLLIRGLPEWGTRVRSRDGTEFQFRELVLETVSDGILVTLAEDALEAQYYADHCTPIDPDEELVEAMARAMHKGVYENPWDAEQKYVRNLYYDRARAALKALREMEKGDE